MPVSNEFALNDDATHHHFMNFHCNYCDPQDGAACKEKLEEGWLTACSHIFCHKHARSWFGSRNDCPICRAGAVKLVRMDMSEAALKQRGRHPLTGMTPPEIIRAAEIALTFWSDQRVFEFRREGERQHKERGRLKALEEKARARLKEAETSCNTLESESSHLQQSLGDTNREVEKLSKELEGLRYKAARLEASRASPHGKTFVGSSQRSRASPRASAHGNTFVGSSQRSRASPRASPHGNTFVSSSQRSFPRSPGGLEYPASSPSQKRPDRRPRPDLQTHPSQPHQDFGMQPKLSHESQGRSRAQMNFGDLDSIAEASQRHMPGRDVFPVSPHMPGVSDSVNFAWLGGAQPRQGYHGPQSRYSAVRRSVSNPRFAGPYANLQTPPQGR